MPHLHFRSGYSSTRSKSWRYLLPAILLFCKPVVMAQAGTPAFIPMDTHAADAINLYNLNVLVNAPIFSQSGAFPLSINFYANSFCTISGFSVWECGAQSPGVTNFAAIDANRFIGPDANAIFLQQQNYPCPDHTYEFSDSQWVIVEANGTQHPLPPSDVVLTGGDSTCRHTSFTDTTIDGSGITVTITGGSSGLRASPFLTSSGLAFSLPETEVTGSITDSNANVISTGNSGSNYNSLIYSTLSSTTAAVTVSPNVFTPTSISWTNVANSIPNPTVLVTKSNIAWETNFQCSGITDVPAGSPSSQITGLSYPDGTSLGITYEQTNGKPGYYTGRIGQLTLRSGGTISYKYTTNCSGQTTNLVRATTDGTTSYSSATNQNTGAVTTTVTDNGGNSTVYNFSGPNSYSQVFVTAVQYNQGNGKGQSVLRADSYCYNPTGTTCQTPITLPITALTISTTVGTQTRQSSYTYDKYGNVLTDAEYDYGLTTPTITTTTVYGSWNSGTSSCNAVSSTINNKPCTITVTSGSNTIAQSQFTYDGYGNLLTKNVWTGKTSGTQWLTTSATYNSNGTAATSTDPAGNITRYYYNGTGGCNGLFPTSIVAANSMTSYETWNCTGGVVVSKTDPNNAVTTYSYENSSGVADPFWRIMSVTDPLQNTTYTNYASNALNSSLTFNSGNSILNVTNIVDAYGRPINTQRQQGPGASQYDTTSTEYGWNKPSGSSYTYRSVTTTLPCPEPSGSECPFTSSTTQMLTDPLGRTYTTTDGGGGTVTKTYTNNDVLSVLGPAPTGENSKSVQTEYDGLGRVKSICGIMVSNGYSSCSQNTGSYSGQFTSYSYSYASGSSTTTVTRGGQSRSKTFDALGRVISSSTPEGGTVTYYYDTVPSFCNGGALAVAGKLIGVLFASANGTNGNGNYSCYEYDSLGRTTAITGVFAGGSNPVCRRFFYDNSSGALGSIPSGITINRTYGRMVEAETDTCAWPITSSSMITDEWFSYNADGQMIDMWEMTPHSGQYYQSVATFAANGVVTSLQLASPSLYTITYGLEGEGRWNTMTDASTNIVTGPTSPGAMYNAAGQPLNVQLTGSTPDQDIYTYDATGRMKTFEFEVGNTPSNLTGTLTWNPNGTLEELQIVDGFNSGGTQTCFYNSGLLTGTGYDDLNRLIGVSCGTSTPWNQSWIGTYTYGQYDNLTKAGTVTWNPGYSQTTNQVNGATYDASGDMTNDGNGNVYGWDPFNKIAWSANSGTPTCGTTGRCVTYDALGRMVEVSHNGIWTELWYTQVPGSTVAMNGVTENYAYWPAPGRGVLVDTPTSDKFMHQDWLGNDRIVSAVLNHLVNADRAYAPFGEQYNTYGSTDPVYGIFAQMTGDYDSGVLMDTPNREYAQNQGRWISPDPAGAGWNQYAYPTNPNSQTDPSGLCGVDAKKQESYLNTCNGGANELGGDGYYSNLDMLEAGLPPDLSLLNSVGATGSTVPTDNASAVSSSSSGASDICFCSDNLAVPGGATANLSSLNLGPVDTGPVPSLGDPADALQFSLTYNSIWADPVTHYGIMILGLLGGVDGDLGGEGLDTVEEGDYSTYENSTNKSALVPNSNTNESATDAMANLQANGYAVTSTSGPSITFTGPDGSTYVFRPSNSSPSGWAADYIPAGGSGFSLKINFTSP